MGLAHSNY
jgi:hypothetical protein